MVKSSASSRSYKGHPEQQCSDSPLESPGTPLCSSVLVKRVEEVFQPNGPDLKEQLQTFAQMPVRISILRPTLIGLGTALVTYAVAAHLTNVYTDLYITEFPIGSYEDGTMIRNATDARSHYEKATTRERTLWLQIWLAKYIPESISSIILTGYTNIALSWDDSQQSERVMIFVTAICTAVFLGWQIPLIYPCMLKSWMHHPFSGRSYTNLTSVFSHVSVPHLIVDMCALWLFKPALQWISEDNTPNHLTIPEGTSIYHLLAFMIASGIFSKLIGHYAEQVRYGSRVRALMPCTVSALLCGSNGFIVTPVVGFSGVICAELGVYAVAFPETRTTIPVLGIEVNAHVWMVAAIAVEVFGVIRGWTFGHAAHLGGWAFGALYARFGFLFWEATRTAMVRLTGGSLTPGSSL